MNLISILGRPRSRTARQARAEYFAIQDAGGAAVQALFTTSDHAERARLAATIADSDSALAKLHPSVFGPDPNEHEDGRDMAVSLASSAQLALLYAACERILAQAAYVQAQHLTADLVIEIDGHQRQVPHSIHLNNDVVDTAYGDGGTRLSGLFATGIRRESVFSLATERGAGAAEAHTWQQLAGTTDPAERESLLNQLWEFARDRAGGQAAEILDTFRRSETRTVQPGLGVQPRLSGQSVTRLYIAAVFFVLGALIAIPMANRPLHLTLLDALVAAAVAAVPALWWVRQHWPERERVTALSARLALLARFGRVARH